MKAWNDAGSGTVLGLAVVGAVLALAAVAAPIYKGLVVAQSVGGAADAAALGGADVAVGIAPGSPCSVAGRVAAANSSSLVSCAVDGNVVTVRVQRRFLGLLIGSSATAGPPIWVSN